MSAPELSAEEQATVDRFGIFAEEQRVEKVARAIALAETEHSLYVFPCRCGWSAEMGRGWEKRGEDHRREALAVAAIEALRP
jgi:hypothetical protein